MFGLGLVSVLLAVTGPDYREGPWRGEYYSTPDMQGEPLVRRAFEAVDSGPLEDPRTHALLLARRSRNARQLVKMGPQ